jgi:hypothetical protein
MANQEHLEILKQGVDVWNQWRENNPWIIPDLWGVDLSDAQIPKINFQGVNLVDADFSNADLTQANFISANIRKGNFTKANLSRSVFQGAKLDNANFTKAYAQNAVFTKAHLYEACFTEANLSGSDFTEANMERTKLDGTNLTKTNLFGVNFTQALLYRVNLTNATIGNTVFANAKLYWVTGLKSLSHKTSSSISIDTILMFRGDIPDIFLRGCGLPDEFIEYIPSLTRKGIKYYSCFISYSHKDDDFAKRLHNDLQAKGVRCWFAPHDMKIGDKIRPTIDDSIRLHDKLLLILSEHSVESDWVEHEVEHALDLERERKKTSLFPVKIDDTIMESTTGWAGNVKRQRHIGDFTQWKQHDAYQAAFDRLLRDLKA